LASLAGSGALTATVVWFARSWISERLRNSIKHEYDQKLEAFRAALKAEHDANFERLRTDLRIDAFRQQTRFADLHTRRAETIADTFATLRKLRSAIQRYVTEIDFAREQSREELRQEAATAFQEFEACFLPREIFLPMPTAEKIDGLRRKLFHVAKTFQYGVERGEDEKTGKDSWREANDLMGIEANPILEELKVEMRELLGDQPTQNGGAT
jgi:hypothetical protein